MNIVKGDTIQWVSGKGNWFTAEVRSSTYNEKGQHIFKLKFLELGGYKRNPKATWRGKDLYTRVFSHTPGDDHDKWAETKTHQKHCAGLKQYETKPETNWAEEMEKVFAAAREEEAVYAAAGIFEGSIIESYYSVYFAHRDERVRFVHLEDALASAASAMKKHYCYSVLVEKVEVSLARKGAVCEDSGYQILVRDTSITCVEHFKK